MDQFDEYEFSHIPRIENKKANAMAQVASRLILPGEVLRKSFIVEKRVLSLILTRVE